MPEPATPLSVKTFQHNDTGFALKLTSGQIVLFEKIHSIDALSVDDMQDIVNLSLTLVDGRTLIGASRTTTPSRAKTTSAHSISPCRT